ncbi:MAG: hypothetical protein LBR67_10390 [Dysgonamonadaceae bacterium]|nr:hypothetical protein [Dysgonamonadaceae bacterium]
MNRKSILKPDNVVIKRQTVSILLYIILAFACTSSKNTPGTRWYHSFNTKYNVYFNGNEAFKEALKTQQENYTENYSEMIHMFPISATDKEKEPTKGPFDKAIEKSVKAIKTHSIQSKPEKQSGKRNDPKYQEFMSREEYNPFLHNAWMLMAQSQFYNGSFLQAASSFSFIARHYASQEEIVTLAKLWQARSYTELEWFYEAEDLFSKINNINLSKKASDLFATFYADLLIKQKQYKEAVPYLQIAIKAAKGTQKARMNYLLGQIYVRTDQENLAYNAFGKVIKSNPPYPLEFSARIRQTEVYPGGNTKKVIKVLEKMAKSSKNKDYLDQVYYALGNVHMSIPDTAKAIESYALGIEKSVKNEMDKAFCQIKLGDIYFTQRNYVKAQPCYADALSQIKKENTDYERVSKRSEALDELVIHYEAVQLQDSLQRLSRMTDNERLAVVAEIIETLKKEEAEAKKNAEREEFLAEMEAKQQDMQAARQGQRPAGAPGGMVAVAPAASETFYFYNQQTVAVGKNTFQQKWGRRKLEDDWRRRNKTNPMSDQFNQEESAQAAQTEMTDTTLQQAEANDTTAMKELSTNPHDPQFYLQQIPVTEEDIAASNLIIMDGLFNMGLIYKDKLEAYDLSVESFTELNTRFPDNENKLESYYNLYLIYLRLDNPAEVALYKSKIIAEFPESDYAVAMADPNYEYNIRMMDVIQDSIYVNTYRAYIDGVIPEIRDNYETMKNKYSQSKLMPKFMFINALSYVMTQESDTFKVRLKELIDKYPDADVSVLAGEMMKGFQRGLDLAGNDANLAKGDLFNIRLSNADGGGDFIPDSTLAFSAEKNTPYMLLLIYPKARINENMLLFLVASYNFTNFMVADFDLQLESFDRIGMLQIKGFNNYAEAVQYWNMVHQPEGYAQKLDDVISIVPVSVENYTVLTKGKSLEDYAHFFESSYGEDNRALIEKWKLHQQKSIDELAKTAELPQEVTPEELDIPDLNLAQPLDTIAPEVSIEMDSVQTLPTQNAVIDTIKTESENDLLETVDESIEKVAAPLQNVNKAINEFSSDPIRSILNLFKKKKVKSATDEADEKASIDLQKQAKEQEKAQKEAAKAEKKKADELAKQQEKERKELIQKQEAEEKALLKQKELREKELEDIKKAEAKQKEDEKKRLADEKKEAKKLKEQEYKEKQKKAEEARKAKEKAYKEEQKAKKKAREEAQKQKDAERKAAQKQKEEERKLKNKK